MPTTTLAGRKGAVLLGNPATPTLVGQARSWKFDIDTDLIENTQGYGGVVTPWKEYIQAALSWTGTVEGNFDLSSGLVFNALVSNATFSVTPFGAIPLYLYPDLNVNPTRYYAGLCWPKLSVEARLLGVIRFAMDLTGHGALGSY